MFYKVDSHLTSLASSKFFERYGGPSPLARRTQMPPLRYGRADSPSTCTSTCTCVLTPGLDICLTHSFNEFRAHRFLFYISLSDS